MEVDRDANDNAKIAAIVAKYRLIDDDGGEETTKEDHGYGVLYSF